MWLGVHSGDAALGTPTWWYGSFTSLLDDRRGSRSCSDSTVQEPAMQPQ